MPAKTTVWSPTTSPPRSATMPISSSVRLPTMPSRARRLLRVEVAAEAGGDGAAERQRGAARRVDLHAVVDLDDLGIEAVAERRGGGSTSLSSTLTPTLMLAAMTQRVRGASAIELALLVGRVAGRADDDRGAAARPRCADARAPPPAW